MSTQDSRKNDNLELMGDNIIGIYLSKETQCDSNTIHPKLRRFIHHEEQIQHSRPVGEGSHGVVRLVTIKDRTFAMKVFKDYKQPGPVYYTPARAIYTSPLACESRAFARLDECEANGTWAVRCHGWMKLSDAQFEAIGGNVSTQNLSRWAIVKEYLPNTTTPSDIQAIVTNFNISREARILPQDIRIENYRGSKIVDLSSALTDPCPEWSDFAFEHFYEHATKGALDWFGSPATEAVSPSPRFTFARPFAFALRFFCLLVGVR